MSDSSSQPPQTGAGGSTTSAPTASEGSIAISVPSPVEDELAVISIGKIDFDGISKSSNRFNVELRDENKISVLRVNIYPNSGLTCLASNADDVHITWPLREVFSLDDDEHYILIHWQKQQSRFLLQYDSHYVGIVEAPSHSPLKSITYMLGSQSGFKGPISGTAYSGLSELSRSTSKPYTKLFPPMYKEKLFQQILACNPGDAGRTIKELEALRREISGCQISSSGAKWKGQNFPKAGSTLETGWYYTPHSVCVYRCSVTPENIDSMINIMFVRGPAFSLGIGIQDIGTGVVTFQDYGKGGKTSEVTLAESMSMYTTGEHYIALVMVDGKTNVIFDFKQLVVLSEITMNNDKPKELYSGKADAVVDTYEFGS